LRLAHRITSRSPDAIRIGKRAFYTQQEMPLAQAYDYASRIMVENMLIADAKEGIAAFIAKRPPKWGTGGA
jgi:enoyl-CoA hydratase/carnithine racemase